MSSQAHAPEICHQLVKFWLGPDGSIDFGISFHHEPNVPDEYDILHHTTGEECLFAVCTR